MPQPLRAVLVTPVLFALVSCAPEQRAEVRIESPAAGAVITGDSVPVQLSASGVDIVAADGEATPGRAHHHLFLDVDVTPAGAEIPDQTQGITHLGTGASSFTLKNVEPGDHRLIAVLARGDHVPLQPWAVDTVFFTVRGADPTTGAAGEVAENTSN